MRKWKFQHKCAFLQPWVELLREHLTPSLDLDKAGRYIMASFRCCVDKDQYMFMCEEPYHVYVHHFRVKFPADEASRRRQKRAQRIREALELFDMLSAVDNAAFCNLLIGYKKQQPSSDAVCPCWTCYLSAPLTSQDPVAHMPAVSWGALFGCPNDPHSYSPEFRAAMLKLKSMGLEDTGTWHNMCVAVDWGAINEATPVYGTQGVDKPMKMKSPPVAHHLSCQLVNLFNFQAPPVVQMCAFQDWSVVVDTWRQSTITAPPAGVGFDLCPWIVENPAFVSTALLEEPTFAKPAFTDITSALAQADLTSLDVELQYNFGEDAKEWDDICCVGRFLTTVVCGFSLCELAIGDLVLTPVERRGKVGALKLAPYWDSNELFACAMSAVAQVTSTRKLAISIEGGLGEAAELSVWEWLAYSLWSSCSETSVEEFDVLWFDLTERDLSAVDAVMRNGYPYQARGHSPAASVYGYIDVQPGTALIRTARGDATLVFSREWRCRAHFDPLTMGSYADVVIPGYGVRKIDLSDGVNTFVADMLVDHGSESGTAGSTRLKALRLQLIDVENDSLIPRLLSRIGGNIRKLSIRMCRVGKGITIDLSALAVCCPKLTELSIECCDVKVPRLNDALRQWPIKDLKITDAKRVWGLDVCFSDKTFRMARECAFLEVFLPTDKQRLDKTTRATMKKLKSHGRDFLPTVKKKFPLRSKLAMISIVRHATCARHSRRSTLARRHMDASILSMIFAYAATPEQRFGFIF